MIVIGRVVILNHDDNITEHTLHDDNDDDAGDDDKTAEAEK